MFGRQKQTESLNGGTVHAWSWPRSDRARRREQERADAEQISEVRWLWRSACAGTPLAPMVYTPSGPSRAVPLVDHVDLGPPITLTVKVRPGQTIADFLAAAPAIAPAMGVAELRVIPFVQQWVRVVLVPAPTVSMPSGPSDANLEVLRYTR
jgi:hypothetical protein